MECFQEAVIHRRTNYALGKNIPVLPSQIVAAVERMTKEVPSAFNMQSARVVLAMGEHHDKVWDITKETLRKIVPADKFGGTESKLNGFAAGYGTILFFEETESVKAMQDKFAPYADNFPIWASQANGMLQFAIWTILDNMGLGVNLQHYNPLIDEEVKKYFKVPDSWTLVAEMVFGELLEPAKPIDKLPIEERVKVFR
ncbi:MAG: nitroreductase family protein [Selenomonadaceae bacterium]|nr:nitroreductase family protein [Selenomonadaceae bacterium]